MTTFDFSPLFRSSVGFDSIPRLLDTAMRSADLSDTYPPYNIEKTEENSYSCLLYTSPSPRDS